MAHHLNTNKQFMIGNGILAFAVIFVVVIFVYMSMRLQRQKEGERHFAETYNITLVKGFAGDSISILLNDSVLADRRIGEEPFNIEVKRFAEQSALMIVDKATDRLSLFELSEKGGNYRFEKDGDWHSSPFPCLSHYNRPVSKVCPILSQLAAQQLRLAIRHAIKQRPKALAMIHFTGMCQLVQQHIVYQVFGQ